VVQFEASEADNPSGQGSDATSRANILQGGVVMVLALLALGACVAAMIAVSMWDRQSTVRPAPARPRQPSEE
jgi:hypothetical protein